MNKLMRDGFNGKYTWDLKITPDTMNYLYHLQQHINQYRRFAEEYKACNEEIFAICKKISLSYFYNFPPKQSFMFEELEDYITETKVTKINELIVHYNKIFELLLVIFDGFAYNLKSMKFEWIKYISRIDLLFQEALRWYSRRSMQKAYEAFFVRTHGFTALSENIFIKCFMNLKSTKITYDPSFLEIVCLVKNLLGDLIIDLSFLPRLVEKFEINLPERMIPYSSVIARDEHCRKMQIKIEKEIHKCYSAVQEYEKIWEEYRHVWSIDRTKFLEEFSRNYLVAEQFKVEITKYVQIALRVKNVDKSRTERILKLNCEDLIHKIIKHCAVWHRRLSQLLMETSAKEIESVYEFCHVNTKRLLTPPRHLRQIPIATSYHDRFDLVVDVLESTFPALDDKIKFLFALRDDIPQIMFKRHDGIMKVWKELKKTKQKSLKIIDKCTISFKEKLVQDYLLFNDDVKNMVQKFDTEGPFHPVLTSPEALEWLKSFEEELNIMIAKDKDFGTDLKYVKLPYEKKAELDELSANLSTLMEIWALTKQWDDAWDGYKTSLFWSIKPEEMEMFAQEVWKKFNNMFRELRDKDWSIIEHSKKRVEAFKRVLPLVTDLKNPALRQRHWDNIKAEMNSTFDENGDTFTLDYIISIQMQDFADYIHEISNGATIELNIENTLRKISDQWAEIVLHFIPHKDRGLYKLISVDDIFQSLEDNQTSISSMKTTRYVQIFLNEVNYWEKGLALVQEVLDMALTVQKVFFYLENIFFGEDIRRQLPREANDFDKLTYIWRTVTLNLQSEKNCYKACHYPGVLNTLKQMNMKMEEIQKSLDQYIETKRHIFPRFYFLSNEALLDLLGNSKNLDLVQPYIKSCFDNLYKINMVENPTYNHTDGVGMFSVEGEYVPWLRPIMLSGPVECWLCLVETVMRDTLKELLLHVTLKLKKMQFKRDKWIVENPGQMCITASQIRWTTDCTKALLLSHIRLSPDPLKTLRKTQTYYLNQYLDLIRGNLGKLQRLKIQAIATIEIHARDVIDAMFRAKCMNVSAFEWLSQLRFYWDKNLNVCIVRQTNTYFGYGYEYLGNPDRLAITPLTDRCYITLTTALHLYRGGSPKGPAGTGKTETVKDLGKALAYYVIVINCSEGLDYKSMGRNFSGFAQTGAWGCFDEFNRINIEVLSVVAQQILSVLSALSQKLKKFVFEGSVISLIKTCGIFITMNPGYAGRTELPDNLKSMFRPISMMIPDSMLIAEIRLFGEGFRNTRPLAKKVFTLFSLAKQQLSKQDHYDFGLRGMVALLRYGGKKRRQHPNLNDEEVVLLAMKDMNIAKLTSDDLPLFLAITQDLFPNIVVPAIEYTEFNAILKEVFSAANLQDIPIGFTKVIQLYETKGSRHSVMIVGATGSAKSTTWKMLKAALCMMKSRNYPGFESAQEYLINPKALNLGELYGEYNLATGEWADGVLSSIMRSTCGDEGKSEKWILFDGPVDAVWIENMNSVMDDNKVLTLINSDRIVMPEQVSLLFEVGDLTVASPATVSRCGMVFNDYKDFGWRPFAHCWFRQFKSEDYVNVMKILFERYIDNILRIKRLNCEEVVKVPEICAVISLCHLMQIIARPEDVAKVYPPESEDYIYAARFYFFFCAIWTLAGSLSEKGREVMDAFIREQEPSYPSEETVYEYFIDQKTRAYVHWREKLSDNWKYNPETPFCKIFVPSIDTLRYTYLTNALLSHNIPVLITGGVGTGKTSNVTSVIDVLDKTKYSIVTINLSAQTSSGNLQDSIINRLEKRTKGIYIPSAGKIMITFMDDFNMPAKEVYGSQPPLELMRQWIDYGFWYNRQDQTKMFLKDMLLLAAMGPPGGGRNMITARLLSRFSVFAVTFPNDAQIQSIFTTMLKQHLSYKDELTSHAELITLATLTIFKKTVAKMLPTPAKMHYLFNLRDISKVYQGLLRSGVDYQPTKPQLLRLWLHECFRVFSDRLINENDLAWFREQIGSILHSSFGVPLLTLCGGSECPIFCDFMNQYSMYAEVESVQKLTKTIQRQMEEYNQTPGVIHVSLVLFEEAIQHICRVARVVSQPRGHILLVGIGGIGRSSLARLGAWQCQYRTYQIQLTRTYGVGEFKEDLKHVYYTTGVKDNPLSFLLGDNQVVDEAFLEIMNNVLSTGEVANLYKPDEFEEIKSVLYDIVAKAGIIPSNETVYNFLIDRVRSNLHIVLCFSPVGEQFRIRLRQYPSLISCTTIDWFQDWPREALLEVANQFMKEVDTIATIKRIPPEEDDDLKRNLKKEELKKNISSLCAVIHDSVVVMSKKMLQDLKRHNYVTLSNFLELVAVYKSNLSEKRDEVASQAKKLSGGLTKLIETRIIVEQLSGELKVATAEVARLNEECDNFLEILTVQKTEVDEQQKGVEKKTVIIEAEEKECKELADVALADLQLAMPALEAAMKALDALNKKDLTEIKSYGRPPPKVEMVMEAVMVLLQAEPSWAESKRQLGDVNFLNRLKNFDKDHIPDPVLRSIGSLIRNPDFDPEKVGIVSTAAKSLCMWVIAIEKYGKIFKIVAPKKAKLDEAMSSLRAKQAILAEARGKLNQLLELMNNLQKAYDEKMKQKEILRLRAEELENKLDRASKLVEGLLGEKERWELTILELEEAFDLLLGDVLLGTAFTSYVGPFLSSYRDELVNTWISKAKSMSVPASPKLNMVTFLVKPPVVRDWNIQGLPTDNFSIENGIIVTRCGRWPLIIDPQSQAWIWIKTMEKPNGLKIVDFGMADYMKIIEVAMELGQPVLLQNISEVLDPAVTPILNKSLEVKGNATFIELGDRLAPYNRKFRFFITTKLSNPHFPPEICTKSTLVNFAIKREGLEEQLLGIVVREERPALEEQKNNLVVSIAQGKKTLIELEDTLLRLLSESKGPILENVGLFNTLHNSKETSERIAEQLKISIVTEAEIDAAREEYRVCAKRASILFFVLNDMSQIDPMYQFSLAFYIDLFENSIRKCVRSDDVAERLESLNAYHTYAIYRNTCRGLFERHKLLFSFYMCVKIYEDTLNQAEYQFFLKGGVALKEGGGAINPAADWLPPEAWDNILELNKVPSFTGFMQTFVKTTKDWKDWYFSESPETTDLPGGWQVKLDQFQKMLVVRCLRPDRVSFCTLNFVSKYLGQEFTEPPVLDIKSVLEDSSAKSPLIFVLSPGVDPTAALIQLAEFSGMTSRFHSLSLGQGQSPVATRLIEEGKKYGYWVFLANCHLSLSWMPALDKIIELLQMDPKLHRRFRLWLSSSPHPDFPLSILQTSLKMTTEPPKGLKANMKRLYNIITEDRFSICHNQFKYKKLLFGLCFFHAVLIERKKFQQLGWNVIYSFNDSDFEVSENLLTLYLDEYPMTPWDALKYLIAGVCYGGHVTDDWDRRLLLTYIDRFFNDEALTTPEFKLSSIDTYYIPADGELSVYKEYINSLPPVDNPIAFGQHPNADIMSLIIESKAMCETLLSLQGSDAAGGAGRNIEDEVMGLASDILQKIPHPIDYESTEKAMGYYKKPLDVVLLQEISRYNSLLKSMRLSLIDLQKGIQGIVVMDSELEEIFTCINEARIPSGWLKAYPSLKKLGSWTRDLVARVTFFTDWSKTIRTPITFCLAYFTFPTGFLTAVLQTAARRMVISIDTLLWEFEPQRKDIREITSASLEGVYVRGMYLEGAGWESITMKLCEPQPMELVREMPVILFKPIVAHKKKTIGVYECPVYYYPQRCGTQGREAYVVAVDLGISRTSSPHYWIKRGTALLLSLST
ncbi:dynein axonemal heavy chain 2 isoform X2 [Halyomorpha halys]|nr:dynein heavy chain 2, axonemal isoform X2 [Halyomorpha halys]